MKNKKTYSKEFKKQACELVVRDGLEVKVVAEKLAISRHMLYRWISDYKSYGECAFVGSGHQRGEDSEIKRLQRELEDLRIENEILKKAAAYFAKHPREK